MEGQVNKKDMLYFARIIPSVGIYDVCDVIVRTATDNWFVACDKKEKHKRIINEDTYYEEF